jgi:hypothetical protein
MTRRRSKKGGSGLGPRSRRPTQPRRQFGPRELAELSRAERRKLCQVLLTETGASVVEYQHPAPYDELVLELTPLWRSRTVRVRIATQPVSQSDIDRLVERIGEAADADGVLVAPLGTDGNVAVPSQIALVEPAELIARLERSALVAWLDRKPAPAYQRIAAMRTLEREAALLDPVGLRWLPTLALNELPAELAAHAVSPQDLLERVAFRLLTTTFRFGGERSGEASRGRRLPDSVVTWPAGAPLRLATLVDCKASADGYMMDSDQVLRFQGYVREARPPLEEKGFDLRYLIVLSSDFPGRSGRRHPFQARARELRESVQIELVYLRAVDLARFAVRIETQELDPAAREALDWPTALNNGLVSADHLDAILGGED